MFCQGSVNIFKNSKRDEKNWPAYAEKMLVESSEAQHLPIPVPVVSLGWELTAAFPDHAIFGFHMKKLARSNKPYSLYQCYEPKKFRNTTTWLWNSFLSTFTSSRSRYTGQGWHPAVSILGRCVYSQCPLELVPSRFNFTFTVGTVFIVVYQLPMHSVHLKARTQGWDSYLRSCIDGPSNTEFGLSYCSEALFCSIATLQVGRT